MAIIRSMSQLNIKAPPPSPIPTFNGSRSAANDTLTDFLDKSLQVPDLALPESQEERHRAGPVVPEVEFGAVASREGGAVEEVVRAAGERGAFRIGWKGMIKGEELRALMKEAGKVFAVLEERDAGFGRYRAGNREEIVWVRCDDEKLEWARRYIGPHLYQSFSEKMERVGSKLEQVAEELGQILVENDARQGQTRKRIQRGESRFSIYKYNYHKDEDNYKTQIAELEQQVLKEEEKDPVCDYTLLSLHLPTKHCKFAVMSGPLGLLTFDTPGPDTIIATVGQQLEEWSSGEYKSVSGRIIHEPDINGSKPSFSMELKWSSPNMNRSYKTSTTYNKKLISLADQLLIALLIVFFYSIFMFKTSP